MRIYFILVRPELPENIGAAARAMKTMGFRFLRLVSPCDHRDKRARWTAHGSADILSKTRVYNNLGNAIHDMDFVIGTTSKHRTRKADYHPSNEILDLVRAKGDTAARTGIVFGPERTGLDNMELSLCDIVATVPMAQQYPSLNLAQAVMLFAYELSPLAVTPRRHKRGHRDQAQFRALKRDVAALLETLGISSDSSRHQRIMERMAALGGDDVKLVYGAVSRMGQRATRSAEGG
ncbi:MAG: tRNA/rRNA methyltransferase [Chitinivibrionales bacterium]|nr:tRNA/rRNA methyltransferase [Chitinivibrionales bacterium]MBD3397408.1 tRNA/rRNA methyltransferase [Chitinivibrionales bacterium]